MWRIITRGLIVGLITIPLLVSAQDTINFQGSRLQNVIVDQPTQLQFGPDGRLYVTERTGHIKIFTIQRRGIKDYIATETDTIDLVYDLPNHNDDGHPVPDVHERQVTGLFVAGTAEQPVIYVSSSDPRLDYNVDAMVDEDLEVDSNSGVVSRLTWNSVTSSWIKDDVVRGLPRSSEDHGTNGLAVDPTTNTLYIAQGGHTNMGAPNGYKAALPEYALSAAILSVDLDAIQTFPFDLPTLDDPARSGNPDENDPFGGNRGTNQAILTPDSPVQIYATGFRNPYDLTFALDGRLYVIDNGANTGWGGTPINCRNDINTATEASHPASIQLVGPGDYGGHPNPTRGNLENTFGGQSPVKEADPRQCASLRPDQVNTVATWSRAAEGFTVYTASTFDGALKGDLLVTTWLENTIDRVNMNGTGTAALGIEPLFSGFGTLPLDVTSQGDDAIFPGTVWVAMFADNAIQVFEPVEDTAPASDVAYDAGDADEDGYTNADELDNGTSPSSAASLPLDTDDDKVSNLHDADDDNDGLPDISDALAWDASNGAGTPLPLIYPWDRGKPGTGILNTGFTGAMLVEGVPYTQWYSDDNYIVGGALGQLTIASIPAGDAVDQTQANALQIGVPFTQPLRLHTRLVGPYFDNRPAEGQRSQGFYVGTGDQDHYFKLVLNDQGVQIFGEDGSAFLEANFGLDMASMLQLPTLDLYLIVDPVEGISAYVGQGNTISQLKGIFKPAWLEGRTTLAVGLIATSRGAQPFNATWDVLSVEPNETLAATETLSPRATLATALPPLVMTASPTPFPTLVPSATPTLEQAQSPVDGVPACHVVEGTPLEVPRYEFQGAAIDQQIYFIGGLTTGGEQTNRVDRYDPITQTWTSLPAYPLSNITHISTYSDEATKTIWAVAGFLDDIPTDQVWRYSVLVNTWDVMPSLPVPVASAGVMAVGRTLHVFGGVINRDDGSSAHWTIDLDHPTEWTEINAPLEPARNHIVVLPWRGGILVIGGQLRHDTNASETNLVQWYNPQTNIWEDMPSLPFARSHLEQSALVLANDDVLVIGGRALPELPAVSEITRFDAKILTWSAVGHLPEPRLGLVSRQVGNQIFVIGGGNPDYTHPQRNVWIINMDDPCLQVSTPALLQIVPPSQDHPSTYDSRSLIIKNPRAVPMTRLTWDISTALLPSIVFDSDGTKGDTLGKPFTVDEANGARVETISTTDTSLTLTFDQFPSDGILYASIDIDPLSLKGYEPPGPMGSGGVDGGELAGSTIVAEWADGEYQTLTVFPDRVISTEGAAYLSSAKAPKLELIDDSQDNIVSDAQQAIRLTGIPGETVALVIGQGQMTVPSDDLLALNTLEHITIQSVTLPETGVVDVPIMLELSFVYRLAAFAYDEQGYPGPTSSVLTVVFSDPF